MIAPIIASIILDQQNRRVWWQAWRKHQMVLNGEPPAESREEHGVCACLAICAKRRRSFCDVGIVENSVGFNQTRCSKMRVKNGIWHQFGDCDIVKCLPPVHKNEDSTRQNDWQNSLSNIDYQRQYDTLGNTVSQHTTTSFGIKWNEVGITSDVLTKTRKHVFVLFGFIQQISLTFSQHLFLDDFMWPMVW
jgi:hypothetical protein